MHIDDLVEAIFQRLCSDPDKSMGLSDLRLALGVTDAQLNEALWVLSFSGDHRIEYLAKDRVALGRDWRGRCERFGHVVG